MSRQDTDANLAARFRRSAMWAYVQGWVSAVVSFGGGIVMARLLEPEDFGLFAAVSAYTLLIGRQLQLGVPEALLRTEEGDMLAVHSGFWSMQALAFLCALVVAGLAPVLGSLYDNPQYRNVMWALGALFLLQPTCLAAQSELRRAMRHDIVSRITLISALAGTSTSILSALAGFGVYSFVMGGMVSSLILASQSMLRSRWRPRFTFDRVRAQKLVGYGWRVHVANSLELGADKVDAMLIGKVVGLDLLGIYRRADSTAKLPVLELLGRLYSLIIALFARLEGNADRTRRAFRKLSTSVLAPICMVLAWLWYSMADFIGFLYGDKWLPAVPYARILVLAAVIMSLRGLLSMYLNAAGHAGKQAGIGALDLALTVALVSLGLHWGLFGVAWAIVARYFLLLMVSLFVVRRYAEIRVEDFLSSVWPPLLVMALVVAGLYFVPLSEAFRFWPEARVLRLMLSATVVGVAFLGLLGMVHVLMPRHTGLSVMFGILWSAKAAAGARLRGLVFGTDSGGSK